MNRLPNFSASNYRGHQTHARAAWANEQRRAIFDRPTFWQRLAAWFDRL